MFLALPPRFPRFPLSTINWKPQIQSTAHYLPVNSILSTTFLLFHYEFLLLSKMHARVGGINVAEEFIV